jgi:hypothetical protein
LRLVVKSGSDWNWNDTDKMCNVPASGEWTTCSYNLSSDFSGVTISDVRSFLIQTFSNGYSGVIQFDDIMAGTDAIISFDEQHNVFGVAASMDGGAAITEIKTVYIGGTGTPSSSSGGTPSSSSSGGSNSSSSSSDGNSNPSSSSSSSGNNSNPSSSSNSEASPILNSQFSILNSNPPIYYTLKGIPLGETKPSKPGVYRVKEKKKIKKIVVR